MLPYTSTSPRLLDSEVGAVRSSLNVGKYLPVYTAYQPTRFLFNNQPDALIIQIYSVKKTLHFSGIFSAHHQEFSTVSKQSQDGTAVPS